MADNKPFEQLTLQIVESLYEGGQSEVSLFRVDSLIAEYSGQQIKLESSQQNESLPELMISRSTLLLWHRIKEQIPNGASTLRITEIQLVNKLYQVLVSEEKEFKSGLEELELRYSGLMSRIGLQIDEGRFKNASKKLSDEISKSDQPNIYLHYANLKLEEQEEIDKQENSQQHEQKQQVNEPRQNEEVMSNHQKQYIQQPKQDNQQPQQQPKQSDENLKQSHEKLNQDDKQSKQGNDHSKQGHESNQQDHQQQKSQSIEQQPQQNDQQPKSDNQQQKYDHKQQSLKVDDQQSRQGHQQLQSQGKQQSQDNSQQNQQQLNQSAQQQQKKQAINQAPQNQQEQSQSAKSQQKSQQHMQERQQHSSESKKQNDAQSQLSKSQQQHIKQSQIIQKQQSDSHKQTVQQIFSRLQQQTGSIFIPPHSLEVINNQLNRLQQPPCSSDELVDYKENLSKQKTVQSSQLTLVSFITWRKRRQIEASNRYKPIVDPEMQNEQKLQKIQNYGQSQQQQHKQSNNDIYLMQLFKKYLMRPSRLRICQFPNEEHRFCFITNLQSSCDKNMFSNVKWTLILGQLLKKQPCFCVKLQNSHPQFLKTEIDLYLNQNPVMQGLVKTVVSGDQQLSVSLSLKQFLPFTLLKQLTELINQGNSQDSNCVQITVQISFLESEDQSKKVMQSLLDGFHFQLRMRMNAALSQIFRKNFQMQNNKQYKSKFLTMLALNKNSQITINFKHISEVSKFLNKLGLTDIVSSAPSTQQLISDLLNAFLVGNLTDLQRSDPYVKQLFRHILSNGDASQAIIDIEYGSSRIQTRIVSRQMRKLMSVWLK